MDRVRKLGAQVALFFRPLYRYLVRIGDCLSQLVNVAVFCGKNANESVSGRAYRMRRISWPWAMLSTAINLFFIWQQDHCRSSYYADLTRARQTIREHQGA